MTGVHTFPECVKKITTDTIFVKTNSLYVDCLATY